MTDEEKRIDEIVDALGCSIKEAEDIVAYDKKVDKAKAKDRLEHDLTLEQEKKAKKYANVTEHKKPTVYKFDKRERKANLTKAELIEFIKNALNDYAELQNLTVTNKERQIAFELSGEKFELTLVQKRKPKAK